MKLLHVDASILNGASVSRQLSAAIVAAQSALQPDLEVVRRDLAAEPIGHLSSAHIAVAQGATLEDASLQQDITTGQEALEEFLAADIVVVGAPMYNFGVPSQLKAWIDRLAVPGRTFQYSESGVQGLAGDKKVIVASARGNFYGAGSPAESLDHQETYLRGIFGFFGITDVTVIRAEGIGLGEAQRANAIEGALMAIHSLAT